MKDTNFPQIYPWSKSEVAADLQKALKEQCAVEDNDMATALIEATARMAEISTERLNQVPDKTYRNYLELSGADYLPAASAKAPVQFTVSNNIGDTQQETIPAGFQVSGEGENGEELIFETIEDITVQKPNLASIAFVDYYRNQSTNLNDLIQADPVESKGKRLFKGEKDFTYKLHIGHPRFAELGPEAHQDLDLHLVYDKKINEFGSWQKHIAELCDFYLQYQSEEGVKEIELNGFLGTHIEMYIQLIRIPTLKFPIVKSHIDGKEEFYLTLCIKPKLSQLITTPDLITDNQQLSDLEDLLLPKVKSVRYHMRDSRLGSSIKKAFYNSQELDLSALFLPFGEQPQVNDCFYFTAPEVFEFGYKKKHMRIATQIMGDLRDDKYKDENDPTLLPLKYSIGSSTCFKIKRKGNDTVGVSCCSLIESYFHLHLYGRGKSEHFRKLHIDQYGQLWNENEIFQSELVEIFEISALTRPIDGYFSLNEETPYSVQSTGTQFFGNVFQIKNNTNSEITTCVAPTHQDVFRLYCTIDGTSYSYTLFIDASGDIRDANTGNLATITNKITLINVIPNGIPIYLCRKVKANNVAHIFGNCINRPYSFEFYTYPVSGEDTVSEFYWTDINIIISEASKDSFNLKLTCYYEESEGRTTREFNFSLFINTSGKVIDRATGKEFSFHRLSTRFAIYNCIPINGAYKFHYNNNRLGIPQLLDGKDSVNLSYEYFDGIDWMPFETTGDGKTYHQSGEIICHLDTIHEVKKTKVNNIEDYWLRARIIDGGYGDPAYIKNVEPHPGWMYIHNESGTPYKKEYEGFDLPDKNITVNMYINGKYTTDVVVDLVGPAAPLIKEVPATIKPPMIREIRVKQEELYSDEVEETPEEFPHFVTIGGYAQWHGSGADKEFLLSQDTGVIFHETPKGVHNRFPGDFAEDVRESYISGGGEAYSEEPLEATAPEAFPLTPIVNDNTGSFPALYFGFEGKKLEGTYNSLFLSLEDQPFFYRKDEIITEEVPSSNDDGTSETVILTSEDGTPLYKKSIEHVKRAKASISWQYFGNNGWTELPVDDKTFGFTKSETIGFTFPADAQTTTVLGTEQYWLRAILIDPETVSLNGTKLLGAYQNTAIAINKTTVKNERLGSSNGFENQTFKLRYAPTVGDLHLFVGEVDMISERELKQLYAEKNNISVDEISEDVLSDFTNEVVSLIKDDNGSILGIFVEWNQVENFVNSGPHSRHYLFDHVTGTITFGDGINGMIPDIGRENIIAKSYQYGGGIKGNVPALTIDKMRNRAQIVSKIGNVAPAAGGGDRENLSKLMERGSSDLHAHDRAVTAEDYEILAKRSTTNVAQAVAMPSHHPDGSVRTGHVTVGILTNDLGEKPMPSSHVLEEVREYIMERAPQQIHNKKEDLRTVRDRIPEELKSASFYSQYDSHIEVVPPNYVKVGISADLHFTDPEEAQDVTSSIEENLKTFLHPLKGNYGNGWNFGETFSSGLIEQFIRRQRGVKSVSGVSLTANQLLLTMILSIPQDGLSYESTIQAGHFIDLYYADDEITHAQSEKITLQIANKTQISKNPTSVQVVGFTEGDSLELVSIKTEPEAVEHETYTTIDGDLEEAVTRTIISSGRVAGIEREFVTARRPICSNTEDTCECSYTDIETKQFLEEPQARINHNDYQIIPQEGEPSKCTCYECNIKAHEFENQQPVYYIQTDLMRLDAISKAVMPATYESIDGAEPEITAPKSMHFNKLDPITDLEVRIVRGYTDVKKEGSEKAEIKTHSLSARVVEIVCEDGTIYYNEEQFNYLDTMETVVDDTIIRLPFDQLKGEVSIKKLGIQFPSFVNTNVNLHSDIYGMQDQIPLQVHSVDPESKSIHLTDWDLPYAGDFSIADASTSKNLTNMENK